MTRTSRALRRLGVAGLVAVTVGAGLPALVATSAQAAAATGIGIAPSSSATGAQGTCVPLTVTLSGVTATDTSTVTITLTDPSATATATTSPQSAVFCQTNTDGLLQAPTAPSNATTPASPGATQAGTGPTRTETFVTSPGQTTFQAGVYDTDLESVALQAFVDRNNNGVYNPSTDPSATTSVSFTAGSPSQTSSTANPGVFDQKANDNTRRLTATQSTLQQQSAIAGTNGSQDYTVTAFNAAPGGDAIRGVQVTYVIEAGGANSAATAPTGSCAAVTDNNGQVDCSVPTPKAGTDKITFFVNQTNGGAGSTSGTSGPDANEPKVTVTAVTSPSPADARKVVVTPTGQTFAPNTTIAYSATVTDAQGTAVAGVDVTFTISGVGTFQTGTGTSTAAQTVRTGADGKARIVTTAASNESGAQSVRGDIASTTASNHTGANQCANAAGSPVGTTAAGVCKDTATNTIGTASPSPSATATATASPSSSPGTTPTTLTLTSPSTITPGIDSTMVGTGSPNADVELRCYSRTPENSAAGAPQPPPFFTARTTNLGASGRTTFTLNPGTNTRCFLKYAGVADTHDAAVHSVVQNVATSLSLSAYRDGVRRYHFQGRILPTRAGQSVRLDRIASGAECTARRAASPCAILTATTTTFLTTDSSGKTIAIWRINRTFTGSGQFSFVARTPQTLTNVAGRSNTRLTVIH